ncbi:hypothetical protein D3C84_850370 [compost metagenome]
MTARSAWATRSARANRATSSPSSPAIAVTTSTASSPWTTCRRPGTSASLRHSRRWARMSCCGPCSISSASTRSASASTSWSWPRPKPWRVARRKRRAARWRAGCPRAGRRSICPVSMLSASPRSTAPGCSSTTVMHCPSAGAATSPRRAVWASCACPPRWSGSSPHAAARPSAARNWRPGFSRARSKAPKVTARWPTGRCSPRWPAVPARARG